MQHGSDGLKITRVPLQLVADPKRVITRLFLPGQRHRTKTILQRVLSLSRDDVHSLLVGVRQDFASRHKSIDRVFADNFAAVSGHLDGEAELYEEQRLLMGAYFTCEYSLESVALFNPSIVRHFEQRGLEKGEMRFVMSLRACGEGHVSSIEFRTGVIGRSGEIRLDPASSFPFAEKPVADKLYDKHTFCLKLAEMRVEGPIVEKILGRVQDQFTLAELEQVIEAGGGNRSFDGAAERTDFERASENLLWLARSNYHLDFRPDSELSERVIFPVTENESRGIEDARFVRFTHDDGRVVYYATFGAYNGFTTLPQFIETPDFAHFKIITLNGRYAQDKGMALFPRKIGGAYRMVARVDGESLHLVTSDNIHFWNEAEVLQGPIKPWELVQIGNCGSPIETEEGWLLLTHGVGPMRTYSIGALLLDRDDPAKVVGHLPEPIIAPSEDERDGYVPNVVYSCGALIHNDILVIPFAISDTQTAFATLPVRELLSRMV